MGDVIGPRLEGRVLAREWFAIDVRSLAALRIALALLTLLDVVARARLLPAFYTDAGVVPRSLVSSGLPPVHLSLHMWSGGITWPVVLHIVLVAAALSLLVGWHTRIATAVTWLLLVSLHLRNEYVLQAGDLLLHQLLFWCMFLPVAAVWSLDARRGAPSVRVAGGTVLCWAGAALMLQVAAVYLTAGLSKLHGSPWLDGTAVAYAVGQDIWARALGVWLRDKAALITALTYAVIAIELVGPFALFAPVHGRRLRVVALVAFLSLQVGMAFSIDLKYFPFISSAALLPFVPREAWDASLARLRRWVPLRAVKPPGLATELPDPVEPGSRASATRSARDACMAAMIAFVVWANVAAVSRVTMPSGLASVGRALAMDQHWQMYSPSPYEYNFRLTVIGLRRDSSVVTVDDWGESTTWPPLERLRNDHPTRSYLEFVADQVAQDEHLALGAWTCRIWNESHDPGGRLIAVALIRWAREIRLDGSTAAPEETVLQAQECPS